MKEGKEDGEWRRPGLAPRRRAWGRGDALLLTRALVLLLLGALWADSADGEDRPGEHAAQRAARRASGRQGRRGPRPLTAFHPLAGQLLGAWSLHRPYRPHTRRGPRVPGAGRHDCPRRGVGPRLEWCVSTLRVLPGLGWRELQ